MTVRHNFYIIQITCCLKNIINKRPRKKLYMSSKEFSVNGNEYNIVLTDQVIGHINHLKSLYNTAYEDPESFEDISAEISNTINEITDTVNPRAVDADLDGLIQEIIRVVDSKAEEIEKELEGRKDKPARTKKKSK